MSVRVWLEAHRKQYRDAAELRSACIKATGVSRDGVVRVMRKLGITPSRNSDTTKQKTTPQRTLSDFRQEHDQVWKIRDGLRRLFGGGIIMTDAEFRQAVNGNPARWRSAADLAEFRNNKYRVGGELLWASASTIKEMRKIRGEAV